MLPFLNVGPLHLPTYGLMLALAFVVATLIAETGFRRQHFPRNSGWDSALIAAVAGLLGAKVNFLIEHPDEFSHALRSVLSGAGLTWYGGLTLGLIAVVGYWRFRKISILSALDAVAPALALGYAVARIGCQLSGDGDYGKPSALPWAMSYPNGTVPTLNRVHPAPVYETLIMLGVFWVLWRLGHARGNAPLRCRAAETPDAGRLRLLSAPGALFWVYLIGQGVERFLIEFVRTNRPVLAGLTEAQVVSVLIAIAGIALLWLRRVKPGPVPAR